MRVSVRGTDGLSPLSLAGAPFAVMWKVDSVDGSASLVPGGVGAQWAPSPLLGRDCQRADELGLTLAGGFRSDSDGSVAWSIRDASRTLYLDKPGKVRVLADVRLFNYTDACSSILYKAGAAQGGGLAARAVAEGAPDASG